MIYLKDTMTEAVRRFNDKVPNELRKAKLFMRAKVYDYDSDENTIQASRGRWQKTDKRAYDAWLKKNKPVDAKGKVVVSEEVE